MGDAEVTRFRQLRGWPVWKSTLAVFVGVLASLCVLLLSWCALDTGDADACSALRVIGWAAKGAGLSVVLWVFVVLADDAVEPGES